eukprot:CAMPEP_0119500240 /NCGR_PEP_ID=MMETSP1344-20130328/22437_1 /TAXON_ID=236787 /ORGANISM="Florenciella parvula, Strain CCMP2471" /LENGTH=98 /DNA_ID=CAMNT_0007536305 /DNA_START=389 /DNA_END=682 /DNA_ORIENTATION=+
MSSAAVLRATLLNTVCQLDPHQRPDPASPSRPPLVTTRPLDRSARRAVLQQVSEEKVSLALDLADDVKGEGEGEGEGEGDGVASPKPRLSRGVSESVG